MPLVDITLNPGYEMRMEAGGTLTVPGTRNLVKLGLTRVLPRILVEKAKILKLDPNTPIEGVQVQNHDYGEFDLNVANIWVKIQLSEESPGETERTRIRDVLYSTILEWFTKQELIPEDFVMDILWGPTNGKGVVAGQEIVW